MAHVVSCSFLRDSSAFHDKIVELTTSAEFLEDVDVVSVGEVAVDLDNVRVGEGGMDFKLLEELLSHFLRSDKRFGEDFEGTSKTGEDVADQEDLAEHTFAEAFAFDEVGELEFVGGRKLLRSRLLVFHILLGYWKFDCFSVRFTKFFLLSLLLLFLLVLFFPKSIQILLHFSSRIYQQQIIVDLLLVLFNEFLEQSIRLFVCQLPLLLLGLLHYFKICVLFYFCFLLDCLLTFFEIEMVDDGLLERRDLV